MEIVSSAHLALAAALFTDVQRHTMRLFLGGQQVDVVGDEEFTGPSGRGAPIGHKLSGPEIRRPLGFGDLKS